jgi:hypothetical protein
MALPGRSLPVLLAVTLAAGFASAEDRGSLLVHGAVLNPGRWSPDDVKRQFADEVRSVTYTTGEE